MPRLFISYRRDDTAYFTDRICDRLAKAFGDCNVFRDIDSISLGSDFRNKIQEALLNVDSVLVVIGNQWLACRMVVAAAA
jgi:hypothetical protein